jgi:hypothetical protein
MKLAKALENIKRFKIARTKKLAISLVDALSFIRKRSMINTLANAAIPKHCLVVEAE